MARPLTDPATDLIQMSLFECGSHLFSALLLKAADKGYTRRGSLRMDAAERLLVVRLHGRATLDASLIFATRRMMHSTISLSLPPTFSFARWIR